MAAAACCAANIRETKLGIGYKAQADLVTPNTAAEIWTITKTNAALSTVSPQTEDNAADIGKGDEYPTQVFPTSMDVASSIEKFISSQFMAWLFAFSLGDVTTSGTAPAVTYTCIPSDPLDTCLEMPAFTIVEQIRPGTPAFLDRALVGMVINDWTMTWESGPGRNNARVTVNSVGTGKVLVPSGIVLPAPLAETFLNASSAAITINGEDYIAKKSFISLEVRWNNNVRTDSGFYPGSGVDANGFALRGRMEHGDRMCEISFVARMCAGSPEYIALITLDTGPADISLTGANGHGITLHFPKVQYSALTEGEADGIVTINATLRVLKDPAAPYVTFTAITDQGGIDVTPALAAAEGEGMPGMPPPPPPQPGAQPRV